LFDITPHLKPDDPFVIADGVDALNECYKVKYLVAALVKPNSILEIGVRAGYSAAAFLTACPRARYLGLDFDRLPESQMQETHGGCPGFSFWAEKSLRTHFPRATVSILGRNTQDHAVGLRSRRNLVHIDGDHSYQGCLRDLCQVEPIADWILVDDFDFLPEVKRAVKDWLKEYQVQHIAFPSFRGDVLIRNQKKLG
jgi:hypothetical protein